MGLVQDLSTPFRPASIGPKSGAGVRKSKRLNALCRRQFAAWRLYERHSYSRKNAIRPGCLGRFIWYEGIYANACRKRFNASKSRSFSQQAPKGKSRIMPGLDFLGPAGRCFRPQAFWLFARRHSSCLARNAFFALSLSLAFTCPCQKPLKRPRPPAARWWSCAMWMPQVKVPKGLEIS